MTLDEIASLVCNELPEDWELDIVMEAGCGVVNLYNPDGERMVDASSFDEDMETQVLQCLGYAKATHLEPD